MGNWTRVQIVGTCGQEDVVALRKALHPGKNYENFHCLVNGGIAGLPNWANTEINAVGNFAERDYDAYCARETLEDLAKIAPSLKVKVHVGDDYEKANCVATVTLEDGIAKVGEPEVSEIPEQSEAQMENNLITRLGM